MMVCVLRHYSFTARATMIAVMIGLLVPSPSPAEHRVALLIGNSAYQGNAALATPKRDVKAVATVLRKHGVHTTVVTDLDRKGLDEAIDQFIKTTPINGTALVYFSGYVLTTKTGDEPADPMLLGVEGNDQGIRLRELAGWISLYSATLQNVIVLDGSYAHPEHPLAKGPPGVAALEDLPSGIWIGYAAGANEIRQPATKGLSAFASTISTSRETNLAKLLNDACVWTKPACQRQPNATYFEAERREPSGPSATISPQMPGGLRRTAPMKKRIRDQVSGIGRQPLADPASVAVSPPDEFPDAANPGDEWLAPDGTVFCWCPPIAAGAGFWIGKYEVPQCKWRIPGFFGGVGDRRNVPVCQLRTQDILARLAALTKDERNSGRLPEGWEYALPSPEQWEHAARAGTRGERYFADCELVRHANLADKSLFDTHDEAYLYADASFNDGFAKLAPVGSYLPNSWGLHDVYGNVWEQTDTGALCGGSWVSLPDNCRATVRKPAMRFPSDFVGLRIVLRPVGSHHEK